MIFYCVLGNRPCFMFHHIVELCTAVVLMTVPLLVCMGANSDIVSATIIISVYMVISSAYSRIFPGTTTQTPSQLMMSKLVGYIPGEVEGPDTPTGSISTELTKFQSEDIDDADTQSSVL